MKRLILGLLIFISSCKVAQITKNEIELDNVKINLQLKNCIDIYKKDTVTFIIYNSNNVGFWIDSWKLMIDSITAKNGEVVSSRSLVDYRHPDLPEFAWVDANSEVRISYQTDFFFRAYLKKLDRYYIYSSYRKFTNSRKKLKGNVLMNHININRIDFWTCP